MGLLGEKPEQAFFCGAAHAAFCNDPCNKVPGCYIKSRIGSLANRWNKANRSKAAAFIQTGNVGDLVGGALLDRDITETISDGPVHR